MLIKQGPHYTVMDINKALHSCFILDAANDVRINTIFHALAECSSHVKNVYYAKNLGYTNANEKMCYHNLQLDSFSCLLFAADHCLQIASHEIDLHEQLVSLHNKLVCEYTDEPHTIAKAEHVKIVSWFDLPAS